LIDDGIKKTRLLWMYFFWRRMGMAMAKRSATKCNNAMSEARRCQTISKTVPASTRKTKGPKKGKEQRK